MNLNPDFPRTPDGTDGSARATRTQTARRRRTAAMATAVTVHGLLAIGASPSLADQGPSPRNEHTLTLSDDDTREVNLPFAFSFCGNTYKTVWVNSNGNLTFGRGDWRYAESTQDFLGGPPRVAARWDDLNPSTGGQVSYEAKKKEFVVRFRDVPDYYASGSNTFTMTLHRGSNHVGIAYGDVSAAPDNDGLSGVSCGAPRTTGSELETDLNHAGDRAVHSLRHADAIYELFDRGDFDLSGSELTFIQSS